MVLMWTCVREVRGIMCGNKIIAEHLSPDKMHKLIVFVRDCGATTGFSTQVSILRKGETLKDNDSGNILITSDRYYGDWYNKYGGAEVQVEWASNNKVLILFDFEAEAPTKKDKVKGIEVAYDAIH